MEGEGRGVCPLVCVREEDDAAATFVGASDLEVAVGCLFAAGAPGAVGVDPPAACAMGVAAEGGEPGKL